MGTSLGAQNAISLDMEHVTRGHSGSGVRTGTAVRRETDSARTWLGRWGEELIPSRLGLT